MNFIEITGIAIGLSMDAFAVSVTNGYVIKKLKLRHALRIAFFFGFFQAIMPIIGWAAGIGFRNYIISFDHWIAFGLLAIIGGKMIWESFNPNNEETKNCNHLPTLFLMSIATSIDALAVGFTFAMLKTTIIIPILVIGVITFIISFVGTQIGKKLGKILNKKLEFIGGLILILIGVKIALEHVYFGI